MPPLRPIPSYITSLSDQELADELLKCNFQLGPILPSTRRVYERKLFELQTGQSALPSCGYEPVDDDEEEDDEDSADESVIEQQKQLQSRQRITKSNLTESHSERSFIGKPSPRKPLHPEMGDSSYSRLSTQRNSPPQRRSSPNAAPEGSLPMWVKIVAILSIALLIFLVFKNLESDPASNIPEQIDINV